MCPQELIIRGEAAATLLRAQVGRLAALRREVKFLKIRKRCWDEALRPVKRRRADGDKLPVRRDRGGGGAEAGSSRPPGSSKTVNRRREDGQSLPALSPSPVCLPALCAEPSPSVCSAVCCAAVWRSRKQETHSVFVS